MFVVMWLSCHVWIILKGKTSFLSIHVAFMISVIIFTCVVIKKMTGVTCVQGVFHIG